MILQLDVVVVASLDTRTSTRYDTYDTCYAPTQQQDICRYQMNGASDFYCYSPESLSRSFQALRAREEGLTALDSFISHPTSDHTPSSSFVAAAVQFTAAGLPSSEVDGFWNIVQQAVRTAAEQGAKLILVPELFLGPYFCQSQESCLLSLACENVEQSFILQ